jgi:hypothetical protein
MGSLFRLPLVSLLAIGLAQSAFAQDRPDRPTGPGRRNLTFPQIKRAAHGDARKRIFGLFGFSLNCSNRLPALGPRLLGLNGVRGLLQREGDRIQASQRLDGEEPPPDHEVERFVESLYEKHGVPHGFVQPLGPCRRRG